MRTLCRFTLLLLIYILSGCSSPRDGNYTIELYAINDLHARYFDSTYVKGGVNPYSLANASYFIDQRRDELGRDKVIFIDLGDNMQGDNAAYYFNTVDPVKPNLYSKIANYVEYDAIVVGNHDIEAGHGVYDELVKELKAPMLAANAINTQTGKSYFEPYTIINRNGLKIAIIGMTNPYIPKWLGSELWSGIEFIPIRDIAQELIDEVNRKERPNITILAIHAGVGSKDTTYNPENPGRYLAQNLKGVDVILASHDHKELVEYVPNGDERVLLTAGGSRGSHLVGVKFELEIREGKIVKKTIDGELIPMSGTPVDEKYLNTFREEYLKVKSYTTKEIGYLDRDVLFRETEKGMSDYMNILHMVNLYSVDSDISIAAPLNINGKVEKGMIDYQDLSTFYPFENLLYVIQMTGNEIKGHLEMSYENWINRKDFPHNWDSASGLIYSVDRSKEKGSRLNITSLWDGTPFDPEKTYKVSISSYRASGAGDLLELGAQIPKEEMEKRVIGRYSDIRGLLYQYITTNKGLNIDHISSHPKLGRWEFIN